jgi:hypothetical protein
MASCYVALLVRKERPRLILEHDVPQSASEDGGERNLWMEINSFKLF